MLARITDGIYRQPGSALRELIANAYDADANNVYIQTDAPRFSTIRVRDDGRGLSIEALANLIHHIGGSPKRTQEGIGLESQIRTIQASVQGADALLAKLALASSRFRSLLATSRLLRRRRDRTIR